MSTTLPAGNIVLSDDQKIAVSEIERWLDMPSYSRGDLVFAGFAGTGKSTVVSHLWPRLQSDGILMMAPTGKAADVLRSKGMKACTIHQAIYKFKGVKETFNGDEVPCFEDREEWYGVSPKLLGVDESSMVNSSTYNDIKSKGISCLWIGDHFQLPPVGGDPGIMRDPHIRLEKIHRQAEGSSILRMAHAIRQGEGWRMDCVDNVSTFLVKLPTESMKVGYAIERGVTQTIVAKNATRHGFNKIYRKRMGFKGYLDIGDRIVVTSNDWDLMMFNGQMFTVSGIEREEESYIVANLTAPNGHIRKNVQIQKISLGNPDYKKSEKVVGAVEADYGFSATCHKMQGDSSEIVLYADEAWQDVDRHRYTGITRAVKEFHGAI